MICIATCNHEDTGIYGIAPQAKVMPLRIFDSHGDTTNSKIAEAILYAVDNGADIINMSFGSYEDSDEVKNAIDYAVMNNVLIICSAGDYISSKTAFPARYGNTISVANLGVYISGFEYEYIDIFVNAENIESLRFSESQKSLVINYECGSSASTAILSGIIALKINNMTENKKTEFLNVLIEIDKRFDITEIVDYK
jgi:subtilisin family serine protease